MCVFAVNIFCLVTIRNWMYKKRHLKNDAVPSVFSWSQTPEEVTDQGGRSAAEKLSAYRKEEEEATDSGSEGEGDAMTDDKSFISRKTRF